MAWHCISRHMETRVVPDARWSGGDAPCVGCESLKESIGTDRGATPSGHAGERLGAHNGGGDTARWRARAAQAGGGRHRVPSYHDNRSRSRNRKRSSRTGQDGDSGASLRIGTAGALQSVDATVGLALLGGTDEGQCGRDKQKKAGRRGSLG